MRRGMIGSHSRSALYGHRKSRAIDAARYMPAGVRGQRKRKIASARSIAKNPATMNHVWNAQNLEGVRFTDRAPAAQKIESARLRRSSNGFALLYFRAVSAAYLWSESAKLNDTSASTTSVTAAIATWRPVTFVMT